MLQRVGGFVPAVRNRGDTWRVSTFLDGGWCPAARSRRFTPLFLASLLLSVWRFLSRRLWSRHKIIDFQRDWLPCPAAHIQPHEVAVILASLALLEGGNTPAARSRRHLWWVWLLQVGWNNPAARSSRDFWRVHIFWLAGLIPLNEVAELSRAIKMGPKPSQTSCNMLQT